MTKLSIIIVNYNVKHFLEQCLISVFNAIKNIETEVFVVDNNSVDGSCTMIKEKYPSVILIENKINYGFSVANNQALKIAKGEYHLLLNPDTVVEEDSFQKCLDFMDIHPEAGALGVKMIDGKGRFLPESKRALPTPSVSFYKIFGLSKLFPHSKKFAQYHLGHLDNNTINEIEILPGAFMFMRKEALDKTGLLDEDYFMYGEDIDLSYRITNAGYKNYYYPETTIIHYKGESTKKGSLNYVFIFYNAMIIFARKHFSKKNAKLYSIIINLAIYFRAFMAILNRFIKNAFLPILDIASIFLSFYFLKPMWEQYKFGDIGYYPSEFLSIAVPSYIIVWIISLWFNNGYSKHIKLLNLLKGIFIGSVVILAFYALLPLNFRFSRALILIGTISSLIVIPVNRLLIHYINYFPQKYKQTKELQIVVVGLKEEIERISGIIKEAEIKPKIIGNVSPNTETQESYHIGNFSQLNEIIKIHKIDEIVFCAKDIPSNQIISSMLELTGLNINFKIAQPDTLSIIGSNSIETSGELYSIDINAISKEENIRSKRVFDIFSSLFIFILSPVILLLPSFKVNLLSNCFKVLINKKTWVGYYSQNTTPSHLPKIKKGVLNPLDLVKNTNPTNTFIKNSNMVYAKDYTIWNDLKILIKGFKDIDRI
ncbi:MAG: glycosyltransferase [Bacteroidales bacterium]|nr:glycosyltransferase [Bacteroidales bacterium]